MNFDNDKLYAVLGILISIILRCGLIFHPHSGQGKPPMFGDYEAQRHWMEITVNLPLKEWYFNTTQNDLNYWGLDYPPLTAYHSYICGIVAKYLNPEYVALEESRGYESEAHKTFMRYTVLFIDIVLYIPAVVLYFMLTKRVYQKSDVVIRKTKKENNNVLFISPHFGILLALFYPGLILIDHGHFQYNCVSLAFLVFAVTFLCIHRNILASVFFCLALNYKQMELYHSLPFFVYLLSTCVAKPGERTLFGHLRLFKIATSVIITFIIIWMPFLMDYDVILQVLHRLFPVARGVFEDKVANVWCVLNVFYKFKLNFTNQTMFRYCTIATVVAVLPSSADLFLRPNVKKFVPALINSSLAFFLFSFQVHEKSILLATIPATLYMHIEPLVCFWFLIVSVFSMSPLYLKDELVIAFLALTIFYFVTFRLIYEYSMRRNHKMWLLSEINIRNVLLNILSVHDDRTTKILLKKVSDNRTIIFELVKFSTILLSFLGCVGLTFVMLVYDPPEKYPDLFTLLISAYCCVHFLGFYLYFHFIQFKIPQALEDLRHIKLKIS